MLPWWAEGRQVGVGTNSDHLGPLPSLGPFQQGHVEQLSVSIWGRENLPHLNTPLSSLGDQRQTPLTEEKLFSSLFKAL